MSPHFPRGTNTQTAKQPPISLANQFLVDAQERHRRQRRNRTVAEIKDAFALLLIAGTCVGVVYFMSML